MGSRPLIGARSVVWSLHRTGRLRPRYDADPCGSPSRWLAIPRSLGSHARPEAVCFPSLLIDRAETADTEEPLDGATGKNLEGDAQLLGLESAVKQAPDPGRIDERHIA